MRVCDRRNSTVKLAREMLGALIGSAAIGIACVCFIGWHVHASFAAQPETTKNQPVNAFPRSGEWPTFRRSPSLDGRMTAPVGVAMKDTPKVVWRKFVGMNVSEFVVQPGDDREQSFNVPQGERLDDNQTDLLDAGSGPDDATSIDWQANDPTVAYADVMADIPGEERIRFDSGFLLPTKNGQWQGAVGRLEALREGEWQTIWETGPIENCFAPYPLVGDFDNDGSLEVAVLPFKSLVTYDALHGAPKQHCEFTEGRSYGFFGAYDLDRDGKSEFVVIADFAKHIDVLGYRDGQLKLLWQRNIELGIEDPCRVLQVLPKPVADIDGDGIQDIILNLFNDTGDDRWHALVLDGLTGEAKLDLIDQAVQAVVDVDGDGVEELLTISTVGRHIPRYGILRVLSMRDGTATAIWEAAEAGWEDRPYPTVPNVRDFSNSGRVGAIIGCVAGRATAVLRQACGEDGIELRVVQWANGQFIPVARISGSGLTASSIDPTGKVMLECRTNQGESATLTVHGGTATRRSNEGQLGSSWEDAEPPSAWAKQVLVLPTEPLLVRDRFGTEAIIVEIDNSIVALKVNRAAEPPTELWRRAGHNATGIDIHGDGGRQVVFGTASPQGLARVVAVDLLTGRDIWTRDFTRFTDGSGAWNVGGVTACQVGRFTSAERHDVLVTVRRSNMHSEETFLLSGAEGDELWHRRRQVANRGCGGQPYATADFDGDGYDDASSLFTHIRYVLDGPTGENHFAEENSWPDVPVSPVYWGMPVAGDFDNSRRNSILFANGRRQMVGRLTGDGELVWSGAYDEATTGYPAVGDFDGNGQLDAVFVGFTDGTRCYNTRDGQIQWTLPLGKDAAAPSAVSGDILGNGRDQAIIQCDGLLQCISVTPVENSAHVEWAIDVPNRISSPVLATLSGDSDEHAGHISILFLDADGWLYCLR